ncbi:MAG: mechanosensitive ion channel [Actinobacteria bacterium]|nr:mechanosensitive ion channel [Actinomycetota bacterium]
MISAILAQVTSDGETAGEAATDAVTGWITKPALVLAVLLGAVLVSWIGTRVIRSIVRYLVNRAIRIGNGPWRTRTPRLLNETLEQAESRRSSRIEATSRALGHIYSIVVFIVAGGVVLQVLEMNASVILSSAGFLGAMLAFGAQNIIREYVVGLQILLEDRYGAGDFITVVLSQGDPLEGQVERVGLFTTDLRAADTSRASFGHSMIVSIVNHSQLAVIEAVEVELPADVESEPIREVLNDLAGRQDLTRVLGVERVQVVGDDDIVKAHVRFRTTRPLGTRERVRLKAEASQAINHLVAKDDDQTLPAVFRFDVDPLDEK